MNRNQIFFYAELLLICMIFCVTHSPAQNSINSKPRIIVTSDGEIDDECSLVRFLLYTNEWDVEGIVATTSCMSTGRSAGSSPNRFVAPIACSLARTYRGSIPITRSVRSSLPTLRTPIDTMSVTATQSSC